MTAILILAEPHGVSVELECRIEPDLQTDVVAVYLHRTRADVELVGCILTGVPLGDELENLEFAVGETVNVGRIETVLCVASCQRLDRLSRDPGIEEEFTGQNRLDGFLKAPHRLHLVEIPRGSCPNASLGVEFLMVGGMDEDAQLGIKRAEVLDELKAIFSVQLDFQNQKVGLLLGHLVHGLLGGGTGPGNLPAAELFNVMGEADTACGLRVHNRYSLPWFCNGLGCNGFFDFGVSHGGGTVNG